MNAPQPVAEATVAIDDFGHLDAIFDSPGDYPDAPPPANARQVTIFTGGAAAALYVDGSLTASGLVEDLAVEALVLLGAHVYTGDEHLLGTDGPAAPNLGTIEVFAETVEKVETLRAEATALRAEADYLADEIGT